MMRGEGGRGAGTPGQSLGEGRTDQACQACQALPGQAGHGHGAGVRASKVPGFWARARARTTDVQYHYLGRYFRVVINVI